MNFFGKKMTWGGFFGFVGLCVVIILTMICRAFGLHKIVIGKAKEIKKKLLDK